MMWRRVMEIEKVKDLGDDEGCIITFEATKDEKEFLIREGLIISLIQAMYGVGTDDIIDLLNKEYGEPEGFVSTEGTDDE
jgi:hypothetical protein